MSKSSDTLTTKQARFVNEYLVDNNATQAAIRAGYSEKTAGSQGQRMLKNVEIRAALDTQLQAQAERTLITADYVLAGIKRQAESGDTDTVRLRALELLGKHLALFTDRVEKIQPLGPPPQINLHFGEKPEDVGLPAFEKKTGTPETPEKAEAI